MLKNFLCVALGGATGAMLRYGMTLLGTALNWNGQLPTFLANIIGSFVIGMLTASCQPGSWMLFASVGICGAFTTFSTFSLQSVTLMQQGRYGYALLYMAASLLVCLLAAWLGLLVGGKIRA